MFHNLDLYPEVVDQCKQIGLNGYFLVNQPDLRLMVFVL